MDQMRVLGVHGVIDCDIHCVVPAVQALFPYLPDFWREYVQHSAFQGPVVLQACAPTSGPPTWSAVHAVPTRMPTRRRSTSIGASGWRLTMARTSVRRSGASAATTSR